MFNETVIGDANRQHKAAAAAASDD